jgi:putative hydrolase of the HAD superfamily
MKALASKAFDVIAFDGDDTLWHNERSYRAGRERFRRLLAGAGVALSVKAIERHVTRTEVNNIAYYGYGVSSFVLSLIETSIELTGGRISGRDLGVLIELAQEMVTEHVEVFGSAHDVLAELSATYPLMLVTKGDLLHQRSKLDRSGLDRCFQYVEIVSHKTPAVYRSILMRHQIEPTRFLMVGNSLRSDVLPVVAAGGWAVHVPAEVTWSHEHARATRAAKRRYVEIPSLADLPGVLHRFKGTALVRAPSSPRRKGR